MVGVQESIATMMSDGVLLVGAVWLAIIAIELYVAAPGLRSKSDKWIDMVSAALIMFVSRPLATLLLGYGLSLVVPDWHGALRGLPVWAAFLLVFVGDDFLHYWYHRLSHRHAWLWRIHRLHHTPATMCAGMAYRDHALWFLVAPNVWWSAAMLFLGLTDGYVISITLIGIWNVLNHMSVPFDHWWPNSRLARQLNKMLGLVFVLPSVHQSHHATGVHSAVNANYAPTLAILDRIFGTYRPVTGVPERYGLSRPRPVGVGDIFRL